ncbi:MAG: hypothetical protein A2537_00295 [Candidatus Magasanikbacteria bacterium RIFOXYD2_FULL_36_9]|uniref:Uncharacterized protein n=1 Tax=Candidatus Magasanikbacteria bacterium RIFOXYD2_FULL_36_9 TaxID=1798707 RepID=A0A1F6NXL1_9BACT|nr:MAG: hypothetical protein A2537_00295 [Candidatus Magasanikbacteria bacterium RIFOXYD2_FULL_36_9]
MPSVVKQKFYKKNRGIVPHKNNFKDLAPKALYMARANIVQMNVINQDSDTPDRLMVNLRHQQDTKGQTRCKIEITGQEVRIRHYRFNIFVQQL